MYKNINFIDVFCKMYDKFENLSNFDLKLLKFTPTTPVNEKESFKTNISSAFLAANKPFNSLFSGKQ